MPYKMTFADGTSLENLDVNGNNFLSSDTSLTAQYFTAEKLKKVTVSGDDITEMEFSDVKLVQCVPFQGKSSFVIEETPKQEVKMNQMESDITDAQLALAELFETSSTDITDIELALAEIYETVAGGM